MGATEMRWRDIEEIAIQLEKNFHNDYSPNIKPSELKDIIISLDLENFEYHAEVDKDTLEEILDKWGEIREENYNDDEDED
jgi:Fe-S-cluster formation regulator IscX/YfhJ